MDNFKMESILRSSKRCNQSIQNILLFNKLLSYTDRKSDFMNYTEVISNSSIKYIKYMSSEVENQIKAIKKLITSFDDHNSIYDSSLIKRIEDQLNYHLLNLDNQYSMLKENNELIKSYIRLNSNSSTIDVGKIILSRLKNTYTLIGPFSFKDISLTLLGIDIDDDNLESFIKLFSQSHYGNLFILKNRKLEEYKSLKSEGLIIILEQVEDKIFIICLE